MHPILALSWLLEPAFADDAYGTCYCFKNHSCADIGMQCSNTDQATTSYLIQAWSAESAQTTCNTLCTTPSIAYDLEDLMDPEPACESTTKETR